MITGEGVVVAIPIAGPAIRLVSGIIDVIATLLLGFAVLWAESSVIGSAGLDLDDALSAATAVVTAVFLLVGFPVTCEALSHGRTLGKLATGLRTVRDDGAPADLRRLFTRHLVGSVELWGTGGAVAVLTLLFSQPTRRLGDMAAGTYVARDRVRLALPPEPRTDPALAAWVEHADLYVPDDLAALVRASLAHRRGFNEAAAARVSQELADRLRTCVRPAPPAGAPDADVVDAIMAERRRRETRRLVHLQERRARLFPAGASVAATTSAAGTTSAPTTTSAGPSAGA